MALLMGGPRFRPALHLALTALQQQQQGSHKRLLNPSALEDRPAQRQKVQARSLSPTRDPDARQQHGSKGSGARVEADSISPLSAECVKSALSRHEDDPGNGHSSTEAQIHLPPGSLSDPQAGIATMHLPPLEQFLTSYMQPGVPVVVTGKVLAACCGAHT